MKKHLSLLLLATFAFAYSNAQDTIKLKEITKNPKSDRYKIVTDRPPQAVYVELGNEIPDLSVFYDRRFNKTVDGLGYRVGIGKPLDTYYSNGASINFGLNYLVGNNKKGRFLEISVSQTVYTNSKGTSYYDPFFGTYYNSAAPNVTQISVGYRSQPTEGGFNFRGGISPLLINSLSDFAAYISFGLNF
jgi:hypothetical protein